ncbi:MAG: multicopper oxidase domain-containing protein [Gammaproteobacteria bacterium]|nr:multicopper oxidase domain-containing protein [Gammaproteobacteria bacterium]
MTAGTAAPLPGGTLNPLSIPKYVTPLRIPATMPPKSTNTTTGEKSYEIEVVQFQQQVLPPKDIANNKLSMTTLWGYAATGFPATRSYPAFTVEATRNVISNVTWRNNLLDNSGKPLPHLFTIDRSLHWANPERLPCVVTTTANNNTNGSTDCRPDPRINGMVLQDPYTGPVPIVTHVHGAHTAPMSDGYPEAWFLPAGNHCKKFACTGAKANLLTDRSGNPVTNTYPGYATFSYLNDQPSSTLWYHDHTLGITRLNLYAGPVGMWLIRESNGGESGLVAGTLPGPAPKQANATTTAYFEIPIIIQDRSFNKNGQLFYPDARAFFEGVMKSQLQIPFIGDTQHPSDISAVWNPEAFFNVMVVNGSSWPFLNVEPQRYRFRLLNGCNSRFLNLSLQALGANGNFLGEVPFYQIGADQGLLPKVVRIVSGETLVLNGDGTEAPLPTTFPVAGDAAALLMSPAERADVIVDFSALPAGTARVQMLNTGPDSPFGGFPVIPADPSSTGQVMQFVLVANNPATVDNSTAPRSLQLAAMPAINPNTPVRHVSINEDESASVCVSISPSGTINYVNLNGASFDPMDPNNACFAAGGIPMGPRAGLLGSYDPVAALPVPRMWMEPITQNPTLGTTETWELHNYTNDAHPLHIHLVKFRVLSRGPLNTPSIRSAQPTEQGWKDTVIAYPGEITRLQASFDVPGLFVWHCHILEHEDNEMMLPYCIGDSTLCPHPIAGGL